MTTPPENSDFFNWIANGKACVAHHEAGHAVANWSSCLKIWHVSIMNENGYIRDEHYNEAKCLGVVSSQFRDDYNLKRLLASKSGIVNRDGSITPFIEHHSKEIKKYAKREMLISLAGPVSEVAYGGGDIFGKACSFSKKSAGSDRERVEELLDLYCETNKEVSRIDVLNNMIKETELFVMRHWDKIHNIAKILERDYVIKGERVNSIIGINLSDSVTPMFKD
ncbi:peptidase M41 family protein [Citrobacter freundii]|uniref:peptidase M41 family protein n=1 Tax=Enterobacter sp. JBIWA003 TaxID=2831890 RepID=UPI001CC12A68|nr:peptidase M41 family protein [Enterobacter sp. JBIWA003]EGT0655876.1 peptidase M41 family protein [Citrobacter freundii]UAN21074.1 peptidase M41 family protein [Enterobacter sp. JBIWA003]